MTSQNNAPALPPDDEATTRYLELIQSIHHEWDSLDAAKDETVGLSKKMMDSVLEAVRANTRHGPPVHMPPTQHGPYSVTEMALRSLIRNTVDAVPDAVALYSSIDYAEGSGVLDSKGEPLRIECHISAHETVGDLPLLANNVRTAVREACTANLGVSPTVDVHVEDLHDD